MQRAEHTIEIARPPEEVFPYLLEPDKMRRWISGLVAFTPLDEPPRVGSRSRQRVEQAGRVWDVDSEIVELEPNERLVARMQASALSSTVGYRLERASAGTRLTGTLEVSIGGLGGRLLGGVAGRQAERKLETDLARLKALLEADE